MRDHGPINIETHLSRIALFSGLEPEHIATVAKVTREMRCKKGETLFHRGDPCSGFHIVVYGQIKLSFTSPQGIEKVVEVIGQGQTFGEAIMFLDKPYIVSAQALSDTLLLHVPKAAIFAELDQDHEFGRRMLAGLAMRAHQLMLDVEGYSLLSGKERIIGYLLHEIPEAEQGRDNVMIELTVTKGVIASRLNLTQEHFSRILHELSDLGLIQVEGRHICIPCLARLQAQQHN
ncbi:MAG: Crp/Fnr family transcriptional regulator [Betaproteobacteria bacterium]|nr:Crp/Fnr family transcriptional regulator [Betaproteobacteria bacterium]